MIVNGQEFLCQEELLPFTLEGYPPVEIVLYGTDPEAHADPQVHPLSDLGPGAIRPHPRQPSLTSGLASGQTEHLVPAPAAGFLKDLVCQFEELRQKLEINTGVINSATDALVTITEDNLIVGFNQEAERMFGYSRQEALGQDLKLIVPPPFKEIHGDFLRRYLATREAHVLGRHRRLTARRRDGRGIHPVHLLFRGRDPGPPLFHRHHAGHYRIQGHGRPAATKRTPGRGGQYRGPHRP